MKNIKILILGIDGSTWDILMPLIEEKQLPTFERLIRDGCYGILYSTIPPVTGGAWLSLATGRSPGKTGIIDFLNKKDQSYRLHPTSSADFKGHSLWDYLSNANKKVGIFDYPLLYPPYKINGFMTSSGAFSLGEDISYPPSLKEELEQIAEGYGCSVNYHDKKYENIDLFLQDINIFLDKFEKWIYYLIKNKYWDFLFIVLLATDWMQHIIWKHIDKNHPMYNPNLSPKYKQEFIKFWQRIDNILENILTIIPKNTILFIISDHGFGPNDQTFNLAKWLVMKGYMRRKKEIKKIIKKYIYKTTTLIAKTPIKRLFSGKTRRTIENVIKTSITDEIDFEKSKAYCLGHTIPFGAIYINAQDEKEREEIKTKLIQDLKNLSMDIGKKVDVQIYEPEKLYSGEKINLLPDIIFTINNWRCVIIEDTFDRPLFEEKPFSTRHTGSHRLHGIFLAYGPGIKRGFRIENAKIYDIAPTILHIFGLPIPNDMDGRVLMEIFEEDSEFAKRKPKYVDPNYYEKKQEDEKLKKAIKNLKLKGKI